MVANGRGYVHTVRIVIPRPSVIRLELQVRRPRPHVKLSRREVFRRDNYTCQYCGRREAGLTVDHVLPRYQGGLHVWTNVVAACASCNHRKGGRRPEEARMTLLHVPKEPPATAGYIYGRLLSDNEQWQEFVRGW
jgi:5-methylcytosine-specific restriction endonuclease McrA